MNIRDVVGTTEPSKAKKGTIRELYGYGDSIVLANIQGRSFRNVIHSSDSKDRGIFECELFERYF